MKNAQEPRDNSDPRSRPLRLPGFLTEQDMGLGDAIKRATSYVGIKPCGGCESRAATLNRWFVFSGRAASKRHTS